MRADAPASGRSLPCCRPPGTLRASPHCSSSPDRQTRIPQVGHQNQRISCPIINNESSVRGPVASWCPRLAPYHNHAAFRQLSFARPATLHLLRCVQPGAGWPTPCCASSPMQNVFGLSVAPTAFEQVCEREILERSPFAPLRRRPILILGTYSPAASLRHTAASWLPGARRSHRSRVSEVSFDRPGRFLVGGRHY